MKAKQRILFLVWLMMIVAYVDRVNISLAGPTIMASLHLTKGQFAEVLSAFQVGYAALQIPGGLIADIIGSKPLLIAALLVWSFFTALTGAVRSLAQMIGVRVLFGFGEGIENGAQFKLIGDNFASAERSNANALFLTALALGPAIASPIVTALIKYIGWRALFFWSALPGIVVALFLFAFLPNKNESAVAETMRDGKPSPSEHQDWKEAIGQPESWFAFFAYFFFNIGFWGFLGWMPSYLSETRHITLAKLGFTSSVPYLCGFVGLIVIGQIGSRALRNHRAALVAASYLLAAIGLFLAFRAESRNGSIAGLSLAAFFLYGGFGPFWATALDLAPPDLRAGFTGFVNVGGQIGGFLAPLAVGRIYDMTQSYSGGFLFMIGALVLSAATLMILQFRPSATPSPRRNIE